MLTAEELKRRILAANAWGIYFPKDIVEILNRFLSGKVIIAEEFQANHLPEEDLQDHQGIPTGNEDDIKVRLFTYCFSWTEILFNLSGHKYYCCVMFMYFPFGQKVL